MPVTQSHSAVVHERKIVIGQCTQTIALLATLTFANGKNATTKVS